jgi:hypothetical protein
MGGLPYSLSLTLGTNNYLRASPLRVKIYLFIIYHFVPRKH